MIHCVRCISAARLWLFAGAKGLKNNATQKTKGEFMPRKNTNLKLVTEEERAKVVRKKEEESWKLTRIELTNRVRQIRRELEAAKERYDGALLDNFTDDMPRSLDVAGVNREPHAAVAYLCPSIEGRFERLQHNVIGQHLSDDAGDLHYWSTEVAFQIGMLAGAIYADCPATTIDRFERGLIVAIAARDWEI